MILGNSLERPYGWLVPTVAALGCFFLLLPVVFVVLFSFNDGAYFHWPPTGVTLRWYVNFFTSERFMRATGNSLLIAFAVTPACVLVALPTALAVARGHFPGRNLVAALLLSPLIVPGVVTGVALLSFFAAVNVEIGIGRLLIGMFILGLPFAVRALVADLIGLDPRIEEAARNLGAGRWRAFFLVTFPQLKSGMMAGGVFVFVEAIDNFSVSVFLTTERTAVLPVVAYQYIRDFDDPTVAAMATLLILLSCVLVFAIEKLIGFERMMQIKRK